MYYNKICRGFGRVSIGEPTAVRDVRKIKTVFLLTCGGEGLQLQYKTTYPLLVQDLGQRFSVDSRSVRANSTEN